MKNLALAIALTLPLAACGYTGTVTTVPIQVTKFVTPRIPPALFKCIGPAIPEGKKLTDKQVARLLIEYERSQGRCEANMDAIQRIILETEKSVN